MRPRRGIPVVAVLKRTILVPNLAEQMTDLERSIQENGDRIVVRDGFVGHCGGKRGEAGKRTWIKLQVGAASL